MKEFLRLKCKISVQQVSDIPTCKLKSEWDDESDHSVLGETLKLTLKLTINTNVFQAALSVESYWKCFSIENAYILIYIQEP